MTHASHIKISASLCSQMFLFLRTLKISSTALSVMVCHQTPSIVLSSTKRTSLSSIIHLVIDMSAWLTQIKTGWSNLVKRQLSVSTFIMNTKLRNVSRIMRPSSEEGFSLDLMETLWLEQMPTIALTVT
jgi:hypothetical protein